MGPHDARSGACHLSTYGPMIVTLYVATVGLIGWLSFIVWIVYVDGKRRWPHTLAWQRWVHVITFDADWMRRQTTKARADRRKP